MKTDLLLQFTINGLIIGTLYGMVAMCFVLIYKASRAVNFAQGEFLLVGAWICWWTLADLGLPFWLGFLITMVALTLMGIIIQYAVIRPLIGEPIISVIMVTIGMSVVLRGLTLWIFGAEPKSFPPMVASSTTRIAGLNIETIYLWSTVVAVLGMAAFALFFKYSRLGLAMRATAFNQQVAQSLGVSIKRIFLVSWAISALVSGVAGVVIGIVSGVSPGLTIIGIKVFPAVILGGLDSIIGAVIGGIVIGLLENLAQFVDGEYLHWGNLYVIVPFYILVIVLMFKPYGLFGTRDIERI
jgi:branched-chain amino acid transport system permease protein